MGRKHKHSKDKLYKTVSELDSNHKGANRDYELSSLNRRLKFDTCCLKLNTITGIPVGLVDDTNFCYVFDSDIILNFLKKHAIHPITGQKICKDDLITLNYHKNQENQYHCPITLKPLNHHSKIVANKKSGHVYSSEAYEQLNIKLKHFKDLLTDEPFERTDIITIQDPSKADTKWNVNEFYYIKHKLKFSLNVDDCESDVDEHVRTKSRDEAMEHSEIMTSTLEEYKKQSKDTNLKHERLFGSEQSKQSNKRGDNMDEMNSAVESDGFMARSVTSTVMPIINSQLPAILNDEEILYPRIKKKGYVKLVTSMGPLNIELFCDRTPRTCHNFMQLATIGYYNETVFHRLIKNFMVQGGDPTGSGKGGESAFGQPFKDECHKDLKHDGRGVVAMANSGPDTNKSQFYIILKGTWPHLDGKHTIFGKVMGGIDTLDAMNEVEVDKNDRPRSEIRLRSIEIYQNPFTEVSKIIIEERSNHSELSKKKELDLTSTSLKRIHSGIGGYLTTGSLKTRTSDGDGQIQSKPQRFNKKPKKESNSRYGNFSNF